MPKGRVTVSLCCVLVECLKVFCGANFALPFLFDVVAQHVVNRAAGLWKWAGREYRVEHAPDHDAPMVARYAATASRNL